MLLRRNSQGAVERAEGDYTVAVPRHVQLHVLGGTVLFDGVWAGPLQRCIKLEPGNGKFTLTLLL